VLGKVLGSFGSFSGPSQKMNGSRAERRIWFFQIVIVRMNGGRGNRKNRNELIILNQRKSL